MFQLTPMASVNLLGVKWQSSLVLWQTFSPLQLDEGHPKCASGLISLCLWHENHWNTFQCLFFKSCWSVSRDFIAIFTRMQQSFKHALCSLWWAITKVLHFPSLFLSEIRGCIPEFIFDQSFSDLSFVVLQFRSFSGFQHHWISSSTKDLGSSTGTKGERGYKDILLQREYISKSDTGGEI